MIRHKWLLKVRNTLSNLAGECDSAAAIDGARMTPSERKQLQKQLRDAVEWIDQRIFKD